MFLFLFCLHLYYCVVAFGMYAQQELADAAMEIIEEVEALGGMTKAIESGMAKLRIEESATRKQVCGDRILNMPFS